MNSKETIKTIIRDANPDIDISDGSGVTDILINPLSSVLNYYEDVLENLQHSLSIKNFEDYSSDELDSIAATFFISRKESLNSNGFVKIIFKSPINITIPSGTVFTSTEGIRFISIKEYSINENNMGSNVVVGGYSTGPIYVSAELPGDDQVADKNEINNIEDFSKEYVKVYNEIPILKDISTESDEDLYNRILLAATTYTANSQSSYEKILKEHFNIKDIVVKGFGDKEVSRDIAYEGTSTYNKITSDFYGKLRSYNSEPHNTNFSGYIIYKEDTPPDINSISLNELTDTDYEGLYKSADSLKATITTDNLIDDSFDSAILSESWHTSDAMLGIDDLANENEIRVDNSAVILGVSEASVENINICMARNELEAIETSVNKFKNDLEIYLAKLNSDHHRETMLLQFALGKCKNSNFNIGDLK